MSTCESLVSAVKTPWYKRMLCMYRMCNVSKNHSQCEALWHYEWFFYTLHIPYIHSILLHQGVFTAETIISQVDKCVCLGPCVACPRLTPVSSL